MNLWLWRSSVAQTATKLGKGTGSMDWSCLLNWFSFQSLSLAQWFQHGARTFGRIVSLKPLWYPSLHEQIPTHQQTVLFEKWRKDCRVIRWPQEKHRVSEQGPQESQRNCMAARTHAMSRWHGHLWGCWASFLQFPEWLAACSIYYQVYCVYCIHLMLYLCTVSRVLGAGDWVLLYV